MGGKLPVYTESREGKMAINKLMLFSLKIFLLQLYCPENVFKMPS